MQNFLVNAKVLIVDDFAGFRETIKGMLTRIKITNIDQASNGYDALKLCSENAYQIIFCDYNMDNGPDGQQILEELHQRAIIPRGTIFFMVTAETTKAQVIGAIEYRPDSYLTKPFTGEQLEQRLKRLIIKNISLRPIYDMISTGDLYHALRVCDDIKHTTPKVKFSCLRIKAELYEETNKPHLALEIYNEVIDEQPLLWAMMGVGRNLYEQNEFDKALKYFIGILKSFPRQVNTLDWIAKCQHALNETEKAETTLLEAIDISPKSLMRQASLGKLASSLKHHDIAHHAFTQALHEGNYSCMLKPQHFIHFYENTREYAKTLKGTERSNLMTQTDSVFKKMEWKYKDDPSALAPNLSTVAKMYAEEGLSDRAARMLSKLQTALEHEDCILTSNDTDMISSNVLTLTHDEKANKYLASISARLEQFQEEIQKIPQTSVSTSASIIETLPPDSLFSDSDLLMVAKKVNKEGLELVSKSKHVLALGKFREAIKMAPENVSFALNAAHVILMTPSLCNLPNLILEARQYLEKSDYSDENSIRRQRYKDLLDKLNNA